MNNKQRQEIIDYLEKGDKFTSLLIRELERADITGPEKRTYSSMLDAILGATELYCYMTEWGDNIEVFIPKQKQQDSISEDDLLIVEHGPRTMEAVQVISDYVKELPLNNIHNDTLVKLMLDQLLIAEHEQYMTGFNNCMKAIQDGGFKGLEDKIIKIANIK